MNDKKLKSVATLFLSFFVISKVAFIYCLFIGVWIHMHISVPLSAWNISSVDLHIFFWGKAMCGKGNEETSKSFSYLKVSSAHTCWKFNRDMPFAFSLKVAMFLTSWYICTLCLVILRTPLSRFLLKVNLRENQLSYMNKYYLIF